MGQRQKRPECCLREKNNNNKRQQSRTVALQDVCLWESLEPVHSNSNPTFVWCHNTHLQLVIYTIDTAANQSGQTLKRIPHTLTAAAAIPEEATCDETRANKWRIRSIPRHTGSRLAAICLYQRCVHVTFGIPLHLHTGAGCTNARWRHGNTGKQSANQVQLLRNSDPLPGGGPTQTRRRGR